MVGRRQLCQEPFDGFPTSHGSQKPLSAAWPEPVAIDFNRMLLLRCAPRNLAASASAGPYIFDFSLDTGSNPVYCWQTKVQSVRSGPLDWQIEQAKPVGVSTTHGWSSAQAAKFCWAASHQRCHCLLAIKPLGTLPKTACCLRVNYLGVSF